MEEQSAGPGPCEPLMLGVVQALLNSGADPSASDVMQVVRILVQAGANLSTPVKQGHSPLVVAVSNRNVQVTKAFLQAGADPSGMDGKGTTPLIEAVTQRDIEMVRMLLDAKADPNIIAWHGMTPLLHAVDIKRIDIVKLLLESGANPSIPGGEDSAMTPLMKAVLKNQVDAVKLLLEAGANPSACVDRDTPLFQAVFGNQLETVKLLLAAGADPSKPSYSMDPPLLQAVKNRNFDIFMALLEAGADPAETGIRHNTPLFQAVMDEQGEVVKALLDAGVDPSKACPSRGGRDCTPLYVAARGNSVAMAKILIEAGADALKDSLLGNSAMLSAVINENVELVELLIKAGANPRCPIIKTRSFPLHEAILVDDLRIVKILLDAGADLNSVKNNPGSDHEPSLTLAVQNQNSAMVELLIKAGADPSDCNPIEQAVEYQDFYTVHILLKGGSNPLVWDLLRPPEPGSRASICLVHAASCNNVAITARLLCAGVDINGAVIRGVEQNEEPTSPFEAALKSGALGTVHFLAQHNCDLSSQPFLFQDPPEGSSGIAKRRRNAASVPRVLKERPDLLNFLRCKACNPAPLEQLCLAAVRSCFPTGDRHFGRMRELCPDHLTQDLVSKLFYGVDVDEPETFLKLELHPYIDPKKILVVDLDELADEAQ